MPQLIASAAPRPNTVPKGQTAHTIAPNGTSTAANQDAASPSSSPPLCAATVNREENPPNQLQHRPLITPPHQALGADMAYQRTDPAPFILEGLEHEDVPNRVFMVRAVALIRPPARNEDLAIVTFDPLPGNPMHFAAVRGLVRDFLRDERGIPFQDIHPSSLGQALV